MPHLKEVASQQGGRLQSLMRILGKCQREERKKPFFWSGGGSPSLWGRLLNIQSPKWSKTEGVAFPKPLGWLSPQKSPMGVFATSPCTDASRVSLGQRASLEHDPCLKAEEKTLLHWGLGLDHLMGAQGQLPSCPEFSARSTRGPSYLRSSKDTLDLPGVGGAPAHKDCTNSAGIGYFALFPD